MSKERGVINPDISLRIGNIFALVFVGIAYQVFSLLMEKMIWSIKYITLPRVLQICILFFSSLKIPQSFTLGSQVVQNRCRIGSRRGNQQLSK